MQQVFLTDCHSHHPHYSRQPNGDFLATIGYKLGKVREIPFHGITNQLLLLFTSDTTQSNSLRRHLLIPVGHRFRVAIYNPVPSHRCKGHCSCQSNFKDSTSFGGPLPPNHSCIYLVNSEPILPGLDEFFLFQISINQNTIELIV